LYEVQYPLFKRARISARFIRLSEMAASHWQSPGDGLSPARIAVNLEPDSSGKTRSHIDPCALSATISPLSCGSHKTRLAILHRMSETLRGYPAVAELFFNRAVKSPLRQSLPQRLFATGSVVRPAGQFIIVKFESLFYERCLVEN
jgi:hypothetical protein